MDFQQIIKKYIPHYAVPVTQGNLITYQVPAGEIVPVCEALYQHRELPLKIISAIDDRSQSGFFKIIYVFGFPRENIFLAPYILVQDEFPSLTSRIHQAAKYERRIHTFFGLTPRGHPDLRPALLHGNWPEDQFPLRRDFPWDQRPPLAHNQYRFVEIGGEGIYEIPVGPVHAGIIEPGHFRFSMAGEEILMLEPRLGYSHKGSQKLFEQLPLPDKIRLAERVSGDSSFSQALAFCQAVETLGRTEVTSAAGYLRVVFCELERLANHLGDIGAIMTDSGYNFGGAHGARLREMVMQINERLSGSRFLRGVATVGGVTVTLTAEVTRGIIAELESIRGDFAEVMSVAENSNSLMNRLENAGILETQLARDHGVVGVVARASGIAMDARTDFPYAAYGSMKVEPVLEKSGDVLARFRVRVGEVFSSFELLEQALARLVAEVDGESGQGDGDEESGQGASDKVDAGQLELQSDSLAIGLVEGWRGEIVYLVATDASGEICRVDVRDPSFRNWTALRYAARGNMIPDFPLINKSFNLSYSGNDL